MSQFSPRTHSPFRYDCVGSFLRPESLKTARSRYEAGSISVEALQKVEDQSIEQVIAQQEKLGFHAVTDGEFRRSWWHLDFFWGLSGVKRQRVQHGYRFHDEETRAESALLTGPLGGHQHPFVSHYQFTQAHVHPGTQVKQTIPAPAQFLLELERPEQANQLKNIYPHHDDVLAGITRAYREVLADLYAAGCRTVQFDDCTWGLLTDWLSHPEHVPVGYQEPGILSAMAADFLALNNEVLAELPADLVVNTHICRGNYHSTWANTGGYEAVAPYVLAQERVHAFYLEYDTERAGGFEPLAQIPEDKLIVLGLVTSKSGQLETARALRQRIQEASQFVALDRLALSPQCGFASTEEGNCLTPEQQWQKLALIREVATGIWGKS